MVFLSLRKRQILHYCKRLVKGCRTMPVLEACICIPLGSGCGRCKLQLLGTPSSLYPPIAGAHPAARQLHALHGTERYLHLSTRSVSGSGADGFLQGRRWQKQDLGRDNCAPRAVVTEPVSIRDNADTNWCGTPDGLLHHEPLAGVQSCGLAFPFLQQQQQQQQINTGWRRVQSAQDVFQVMG